MKRGRHVKPCTEALVYCWRGGERSLSLAHTLSRIGFERVGLVPGGYKRYRAGVLEYLRSMCGFRQGLTLVHFSAHPEPSLTLNTSPKRLNNPSSPALNSP